MAAKAGKGKRGLAVLTPEQRKEFGRRGGQKTWSLGKEHKFTPEEAREAGKKGGRSVSRDRAHMAKIGHRGAVSPRRQRAKTQRP